MLSVAVVGLGWWGRTIVSVLRASTKVRVTRTVEVDAASAADFVAQSGIPVVADFSDVLRDPSIAGVVLCTPHTQHTDQIIAAAEAGKDVYCEKPLSMTRADVLRAIDAVNANKVALAVGHERRLEPPILELMRTVRAGELGGPLQIEANFSQDRFLALPADNWRLSGKEAPAGPMTATGIHLLDLSVGVFGEADHVYASVKQLGSRLVNGDTLAVLVGVVQVGRTRAHQRHAGHAVRGPSRRVLQRRVERGARQVPSRIPDQPDAHQVLAGRCARSHRVSAGIERARES